MTDNPSRAIQIRNAVAASLVCLPYVAVAFIRVGIASWHGDGFTGGLVADIVLAFAVFVATGRSVRFSKSVPYALVALVVVLTASSNNSSIADEKSCYH